MFSYPYPWTTKRVYALSFTLSYFGAELKLRILPNYPISIRSDFLSKELNAIKKVPSDVLTNYLLLSYIFFFLETNVFIHSVWFYR